MEQKKLALWLKLVIGGCALCGIVLFVYVLPVWLLSLTDRYPGFHNWAWSGLLWALAVPCYLVLALGARIADGIGHDRSFTLQNARRMHTVATLALCDTALLAAGSVVLTLTEAATPAVLLLAAGIVCFIGLAFAVAAACLSHLVLKAANLQEENDLTI